MLNFEEERKIPQVTIPADHVAIPLDEYSAMRRIIETMFTIDERRWAKPAELVLSFNERLIYRLAMDLMREQFSEAELKAYKIKPFDDIIMSDVVLAVKEPKELDIDE